MVVELRERTEYICHLKISQQRFYPSSPRGRGGKISLRHSLDWPWLYIHVWHIYSVSQASCDDIRMCMDNVSAIILQSIYIRLKMIKIDRLCHCWPKLLECQNMLTELSILVSWTYICDPLWHWLQPRWQSGHRLWYRSGRCRHLSMMHAWWRRWWWLCVINMSIFLI